MEYQYDTFLPAGTGAFPMPFTVTVLKPDGTFNTRDIKNDSEFHALNPYVAYKVHKPEDPLFILAGDVGAAIGIQGWIVRKVLDYLNAQGLLKVDGQPSRDWLDDKMDELGLQYPNMRKAVRNWFENPEKYPEVNYHLKNEILTVKEVAGGRVVVLPTGHTIAYSKAREIYKEVRGTYDAYVGPRVQVAEFTGGTHVYRKYPITIRTSGVTVGCQTVPRKAIIELAKREGW